MEARQREAVIFSAALAATFAALFLVACYRVAAAERQTRDLRARVARKIATYQAIGCKIDHLQEERDLGLLVPTYRAEDEILD